MEQQRRAGVPEGDLRVWDRTESDAAVAAVLALPDEEAPAAGRSQALLDYARQHLAELRPLALAELTRRGLAPGDAAALGAIAGELADRRDIAAQATARAWATQNQADAAGAAPGDAPRLVQIADSGESASDGDEGARSVNSTSLKLTPKVEQLAESQDAPVSDAPKAKGADSAGDNPG